MRSGTKLVLVFVIAAAGSYALLRVYGERFAERFAPTPISAAREFVLADNTVVGHLRGIREVVLIEIRPVSESGDTVALSAEVQGRAGGGMLFADLAREGRRWRILRASFLAPDGERLPLEDGRPALDLEP